MNVSTTTVGAVFGLVLLSLAPSSPLHAQEQDTRPGVAVLEFTVSSVGDEALPAENLGVGLQQQLINEFSSNPAVRVVGRARLQDALQEFELVDQGLADPTAAVQVGRLVSARYMVQGSFNDWSGELMINAEIMDVETTELIRGVQVRGGQDELFDLFVDLVESVTEAADLPPLPAEVREQRQEREIPAEAMTLYARALVLQDTGQTDRAVQTYRRITQEFPQYTEAREALAQLGG